jgi:hypothetical protein
MVKRRMCPGCVRSVWRPTVDPIAGSDLWLVMPPIECPLIWHFLHSCGRLNFYFQPGGFHITSDRRDIANIGKRRLCPWCVRSVWRTTVAPMSSSDLLLSMPPIECHLIWHLLDSWGRFTLHLHSDSLQFTSDWRDRADIGKRRICPWCVRSV